MSIAENIAGRKLAEEWLQLANEMAADLSDEERGPFWNTIAKSVGQHVQAPSPPASAWTPMSDDEARRFARREMPFGQYRGKHVGDVPLDYLIWLDESSRVFQAELHRYLATEQVQREQDDGD
jgi:uncharacterized protein (DUF3820 family)